jgi:RNA 2',3'-cyclic 3'-phosphodiesterase
MLRLFAALAIPDDVADRVLTLQRGVGGARWRPRENLHVTLCFLGEVIEPDAEEMDLALDEAARARGGFEIQLKGVGFFGKGEPHTLFLGVAENPALRGLAADCKRAGRRLGLKLEARKFTPHLTIAYLAGADLAPVLAFEQSHALFASRAWVVEEFGLYSSQTRRAAPSLYRLEAAYALE